MTDEVKFRFDLQGFLVIKSVLSPLECRELSDLANDAWPEQPDEGPLRRVSFVSRWHARYRDLMDHPKILPYLLELLGNP